MNTSEASSGGRRLSGLMWARIGLGLAILAGVGVLYLFNPVEHRFFPRCLLKATTGLDCPGCGGLRATHQLLHGHVEEAFRLNPLFLLLLPVAAYFGLSECLFLVARRRLPNPFQSLKWVWALAILVIAFGVLRNLPWSRWL